MGLCCWIEYFQGMSTWSQIAVGVVCTLGGLAFFLKQKKAANLQRLKAEWSRAGKDVVVLHMFNRARDCPNPSPFPLKLETWLRIHDIKYVPEFEVNILRYFNPFPIQSIT